MNFWAKTNSPPNLLSFAVRGVRHEAPSIATAISMVDYSKWDRMDFGDSSDEDDGGDGGGPRVTSLDEPGRVTIGRDGSLEIGRSQPSTTVHQPSQSTASRGRGGGERIPTVSGGVSGDAIDISELSNIGDVKEGGDDGDSQSKWRSMLTRNGGEHHCTVAAARSEPSPSSSADPMKLPVYWSQDRYAVTLRVAFPPEKFPTRTIRVRVRGALRYADRHSAVGSGAMMGEDYAADEGDGPSFGSVEVVSSCSSTGGRGDETVLLAGRLPRPVHLNEGDEEVDYEIEDNPLTGGASAGGCAKLVSIALPKAVPMTGMVLWWDRPLLGYPRIDVSTVEGRGGASTSTTKKDSKSSAGTGRDERKEAFQRAWDEAHVMFKEKMKNKERQEIEVDDD